MAAETVLTSLAAAIGAGAVAGAGVWFRLRGQAVGTTGATGDAADGHAWRSQHEKECRERWEKLYERLGKIETSIGRIEGRIGSSPP